MTYPCRKCKRDFNTKYELDRHNNRKKSCDEGKILCPECKIPFRRQKALDAHLHLGRCKGKTALQRVAEMDQKLSELQAQHDIEIADLKAKVNGTYLSGLLHDSSAASILAAHGYVQTQEAIDEAARCKRIATERELSEKAQDEARLQLLEVAISQTEEFRGKLLLRSTDDYVNATVLCRTAGRQWTSLGHNKSTTEFLEHLGSQLELPVCKLVTTEAGQAWIHPQVATYIASGLALLLQLESRHGSRRQRILKILCTWNMCKSWLISRQTPMTWLKA